ncbi:MAG: hypothetical protein JWQ42_227 [Edaphobacter sp.]|nr:hypothetical protein [Edaphobacter sp.]
MAFPVRETLGASWQPNSFQELSIICLALEASTQFLINGKSVDVEFELALRYLSAALPPRSSWLKEGLQSRCRFGQAWTDAAPFATLLVDVATGPRSKMGQLFCVARRGAAGMGLGTCSDACAAVVLRQDHTANYRRGLDRADETRYRPVVVEIK